MDTNQVIARLREMVRQMEGRTKPPTDAGATVVRQGDGFQVITTLYEEGHDAQLFPPDPRSLDGFLALQPDLGPLDGWLYLDLETTGFLGAATFAFVIGLGRWTPRGFETTQYFLTDRNSEERVLDELRGSLEGASALVTFNGKAFDVPLLCSRYVMQRLFPVPSFPAHIDFLSLTRSMRRRSGYGQSLKEAVRRFSGIVRRDDIPGSEVPALYFMYERIGDPSILTPVIKHNALDVLDMARLTRVFGGILIGDPSAGDPDSLAGVGRLHYRRGNYQLAKECLDPAGAVTTFGQVSGETEAYRQRTLAQILLREGDWEGARQALLGVLDTGHAKDDDYLNLARSIEKGCGDLQGALSVVETALSRYDPSIGDLPRRLASRKRRLLRALDRSLSR